MLSNKKLQPIVTKLFIRGRKLNTYFVFSCFHCTILLCCTKNIRQNSIHYFIIKIPNKRKLKQMAVIDSSDTDF